MASGIQNFKLLVDVSGPGVVRVYNEGGSLKIVTNEEAECVYSFDSCSYDFDAGASMTTGFSTQHSTNWESNKEYYIKCRDKGGISASGCTIIVKPNSL